MNKRLLIVTNGYEGTWPAIRYGAWVAKMLDLPVTLLGVQEATDEQHPLEYLYGDAIQLLKDSQLDYRLEVVDGQTEVVLRERTAKDDVKMLVIGPLGRPPLRRWMVGRSFRHIMAEVNLPILYVPLERLPLKKILVCMGGLEYALTAEHLGVNLAVRMGAQVTLLHVIQPIDLDYPETRKMLANLDHLVETDTLPGRNLRRGMTEAQAAGLQAETRIRLGSPVQEILAEAKEGNYDLLCMGSAYSAHSLRHLYTPNVTAEVAEASPCPILTARFGADVTA